MKSFIVLLIVLALGGGGAWWYVRHRGGPSVAYRTAEVKRGDLLATIGSTGTVEPEEVVDIGAQVQGIIDRFGTDAKGNMVDYRSPVEEGTVLSHIDDSLYVADLNNAKAALAQAQATLQFDSANLDDLRAKVVLGKNEWDRAQKFANTNAIAGNDMDQYEYNYKSAEAQLSVGEAKVAGDKAAIGVAQAVLDKAQKNVGYCTITSPVKGVIIDRRVNIGQTVVSSLNAPSLFLLAKDLTRIQVWASVNEADIGNIQPGQTATFTVDAYPNRVFQGTVNKVRFNATMNQNVVTYTVEVTTDNSDSKLYPYLTANVQFEVSKRHDVLQVPNAALRWVPASAELVVPDAREKFAAHLGRRAAAEGGTGTGGQTGVSGGQVGMGGPATQPADGQHAGNHSSGGAGRDHATLWVQEGALFRPIRVKLGMTDGANTEVQADELKEGQQVVVGELHGDDGDAQGQTTNPFAPPIFRKK